MSDALDEYERYILGGFPADTVVAVPDENGNPSVRAFIFDAEYDPFVLQFDCDGFVTVKTGKCAWVMFSRDQLRHVARMCTRAEALWGKINEFYDGESDLWGGWEHLATVPAIPRNPQTD
jgi:hypothetical protein